MAIDYHNIITLEPGKAFVHYQRIMKLLLDENLSRRIVPFIQDSYP